MPVYAYRARDDSGKIVEGVMNVPDAKTVADKLSETGLFVSQIIKQKGKETLVPTSGLFAARVKTEDIVIFSQQLATMLRAGMTLTNCLSLLVQQTENRQFRAVLSSVFADISAGTTFAEALAKHPSVFSELFVSTVKVGEETGALNEVLTHTAAYLDRRAELKAKIIGQLTYPAVIVILAIGVITFVMTFVLPRFKMAFATMRVELPFITRVVMTASDILTSYWFIFVGGIIGFVAFVWLYVRTPSGRLLLDYLKLNTPVIGPLFRKSGVIRLTRPLQMLVRTGVDIIYSCEIVKKALGNVILEGVIDRVKDSVQKGGTLADPLRESGEFPLMVTQMVAVGEETGSLDTMLDAVSENYERQLEYSTRRLVTLIEPLMLVFLAGVVAFMAVAVYLPIFSMSDMLQRR